MYKAHTNSHEKLTPNQGPYGPWFAFVLGATGGASQETLAVGEGVDVWFDFSNSLDFFSRLNYCAT
jgi:hypothetical protein